MGPLSVGEKARLAVLAVTVSPCSTIRTCCVLCRHPHAPPPSPHVLAGVHTPSAAPSQVLPIKLTGALLALLSFWLCCRLSFILPASVRTDVIAKLGNWHCRTCLWWCGFWRVSWIRVGQPEGGGGEGDGSAPAVGIVSNHMSWCDIMVHMSHSFPSFVARSQTRRTPIIGIIR